jgi:hypothetical protein
MEGKYMQPYRIKNHGMCFIAVVLFGLLIFNSSHGADHTVTYPATIPCVLWTRGCTPTSASMVLGYWDNYDPDGVSYTGSGRLIDYWMDLSEYVDGRTGVIRNVPNILEELRIAMGTNANGGTSSNKIGPGITSVANTTNGNCYGSSQCYGTVDNDLCWGTITNEINSNRPFVWSVGISGQVGHSLAAWGYTDNKYVITYNTWNCPGRDDWYYAQYDNGQNSDYQYVDTVIPGCTPAIFLGLNYPAGGESFVVGQIVTVAWLQSIIANVELWYSTDGGNTWMWIASIPSQDGWNYYDWEVPNILSSRVRVWVKGYHSDNTYLAGDGTKSNLTINDNPGMIQFSAEEYVVNENGGSVLITVVRTGGSGGAVGGSYATSTLTGSATPGSDYTPRSGTLSWANGDTAGKTFSVPIINDSLDEPDEEIRLELSNPTGGATLGHKDWAIVTFIDNDPTVHSVLRLRAGVKRRRRQQLQSRYLRHLGR